MTRGALRPVLWLAVGWIVLASACIPNGRRGADPAALLDRIGYGPSPADAARARALGSAAFLEEQLAPDSIDDAAFEARLAAYGTLGRSLADLVATFGPDGMDMPGVPMLELSDAKILRAVYSRRQLEAVLTDFWLNHFHVRDSGLTVGAYERDAIRPHVLGRFEDLLVAVARAPAMLIYLDNIRNMRDGTQLGEGAAGINENYARELLELHTVGLAAGYGQDDVVATARCFTGWSVDWTRPGGFRFIAGVHDDEPKRVMGLWLPAGGGIDDGLRLLAYLAAQPTTARNVATKLVRRFVDEDPPARLVKAAADVFLATDGDLREVMRTILFSPEFGERWGRKKAKRPLVLVASTVRALGVEIGDDVARYRDTLSLLGEVLYGAKDPRGYPDDSRHWLAPGALMNRFQFVQSAVYRAQDEGVGLGVSGNEPSDALVYRLSQRLGLRSLSRASSAAAQTYAEQLWAWEPDRRAGEVAGLILSSPDFLTH